MKLNTQHNVFLRDHQAPRPEINIIKKKIVKHQNLDEKVDVEYFHASLLNNILYLI